MVSRTLTGAFGTCGARTLLVEAYRATPWVADSALTHPHSTSHGVQQQIITYRRFP